MISTDDTALLTVLLAKHIIEMIYYFCPCTAILLGQVWLGSKLKIIKSGGGEVFL
jgi:hypothetical protein